MKPVRAQSYKLSPLYRPGMSRADVRKAHLAKQRGDVKAVLKLQAIRRQERRQSMRAAAVSGPAARMMDWIESARPSLRDFARTLWTSVWWHDASGAVPKPPPSVMHSPSVQLDYRRSRTLLGKFGFTEHFIAKAMRKVHHRHPVLSNGLRGRSGGRAAA